MFKSSEEGKEIEFECTFTDGYSLRHLGELLKNNSNGDGVFIISKNGIKYERENTSNTVFISVDIRGCDITHKFGLGDEKIELGVSLQEFVKNTRLGKKDSLKIFRYKGETQVSCVHITPDIQSNNNGDVSFLNPKRVVIEEEFETDILKEENFPNYSGPIVELSKVFSKILTFNPSNTELKAFKNGIQLIAYDSTGKKLKQNTLGNVSETEEPICVISIPLPLVKSFSKIKNISPTTGVIKFYCLEDLPLIKVIVGIGCYGTMKIFLRNMSEDVSEEEVDNFEGDGFGVDNLRII